MVAFKKNTYHLLPLFPASIQFARDRFEACNIGQELLSCGLLVAVCSGFEDTEGGAGRGEVDELEGEGEFIGHKILSS